MDGTPLRNSNGTPVMTANGTPLMGSAGDSCCCGNCSACYLITYTGAGNNTVSGNTSTGWYGNATGGDGGNASIIQAGGNWTVSAFGHTATHVVGNTACPPAGNWSDGNFSIAPTACFGPCTCCNAFAYDPNNPINPGCPTLHWIVTAGDGDFASLVGQTGNATMTNNGFVWCYYAGALGYFFCGDNLFANGCFWYWSPNTIDEYGVERCNIIGQTSCLRPGTFSFNTNGWSLYPPYGNLTFTLSS